MLCCEAMAESVARKEKVSSELQARQQGLQLSDSVWRLGGGQHKSSCATGRLTVWTCILPTLQRILPGPKAKSCRVGRSIKVWRPWYPADRRVFSPTISASWTFRRFHLSSGTSFHVHSEKKPQDPRLGRLKPPTEVVSRSPSRNGCSRAKRKAARNAWSVGSSRRPPRRHVASSRLVVCRRSVVCHRVESLSPSNALVLFLVASLLLVVNKARSP